MKREEVIRYWIHSSEQDYEVAKSLFKNKKFHYSLFFCHLSVEKYLKAIIVKNTESAPPFTHDLIRLAEKAGIPLSIDLKHSLIEITSFNIKTRYDDYKLSFYKKATRSFTQKYLNETKEILVWLKKHA